MSPGPEATLASEWNRDRDCNLFNNIQIARFAAERRVEIDDVQIITSLHFPFFCERDRIVGIDRFLRRPALAESDDMAAHQINRGKNDHRLVLRCHELCR